MSLVEENTITKGGNIPGAETVIKYATNQRRDVDMSMMFNIKEINERAQNIHGRNVTAGWWTDIKTKESTLTTRNRAELLMLVVSEVSEAYDGISNKLFDDKLPHLKMFDVELADVAIRLFDMIGAEISVTGNILAYPARGVETATVTVKSEGYDRDLMKIVNEASAAMEHLRKSRTEEYRFKLYDALVTTFAVAAAYNINLYEVIDEKTNFNANRPDHKLEARLAHDGKKF